MRRWLSRLVTIWLVTLAPSLIVGGLLVRANAGGPMRVVRWWSWCADRVAFPLLAQPLTDPAKTWLLHRFGVWSAAGFAILLALWCLMLALPLSLLLSWADWFGGRFGPQQSVRPSYDPYATLPLTASAAPAVNALYLVTIPMALAWHAVRFAWKPALIAFVVAFGLRMLFLIEQFGHGSAADFSHRLSALETERRGRFHLLGAFPPFARLWARQLKPSKSIAHLYAHDAFGFRHQVIDHQGDYHFIYSLFALDALFYGIIAAAMIGLIAVVVRVFKTVKA